MTVITWICGFTFKEKKKFAELKALLVLEPVNLVIKKSRLCRDVKCRDDIDWVKDCVTTELD